MWSNPKLSENFRKRGAHRIKDSFKGYLNPLSTTVYDICNYWSRRDCRIYDNCRKTFRSRGGAEDISQMTRLNTFKMFIITKAARKKIHKNMRQKPGYIYFKSEHFLGAHLICDSVIHKINP